MGASFYVCSTMKRPDPMIAAKPGAQDVQAMAARTLWLEELFFLDASPPVEVIVCTV